MVRAEIIQGNLNVSALVEDSILKGYRIITNLNMLKTKIRLLNLPNVKFANAKVEKPDLSRYWRINSKQFIKPNKDKLS